MPAWATPELDPVWWRPSSASRSRTTIRRPGSRRWSSRAVATPRMPPPTTATSQSPDGSACVRALMGRDRRVSGVRVLVTGASGFAGSSLVPRLQDEGHAVRAFGRDAARIAAAGVRDAEIVTGDAVTGAGLAEAMDGVEVAFYLIHSME